VRACSRVAPYRARLTLPALALRLLPRDLRLEADAGFLPGAGRPSPGSTPRTDTPCSAGEATRWVIEEAGVF